MKIKVMPHGYFSRIQNQHEIKQLFADYRLFHDHRYPGRVVCAHKNFYEPNTVVYIKDTSMPFYMLIFKFWRDFFNPK